MDNESTGVRESGPAAFDNSANWGGELFELEIDLGTRHDPDADQRLLAALTTIWDDERLEGCYLHGGKPRALQERRPPTLTDVLAARPLFGVANIPLNVDGSASAWCAVQTTVCRMVDLDGTGEPEHDWVSVHSSTDALDRCDRSGRWVEPLSAWFAEIAARVHRTVPVLGGVIGFEVSGEDVVTDPADVPGRFGVGYLVVIGAELRYIPVPAPSS